jgi:hypothetical protein
MARHVPAKENGRSGSFVLIWQVYRGWCGRVGGRVIYETRNYVKSVADKTKFCMLLYLWIILSLYIFFFWVFPRRQIKFCRRFFNKHWKMDLTEGSETSAKQSDAGEIPKREYTRFRTRRKFEIKKYFKLD